MNTKRLKTYHSNNIESSASKDVDIPDEDDKALLPGLPNHLAYLCLSSLNPKVLYSVCHSWRRLIYSPSFPPFYSLYTIVSTTRTARTKDAGSTLIKVYSFDPISSLWQQLPCPPPEQPMHLLHYHPSFLSRKLPIQSVKVSNHLVLIAATTEQFLPALSCPLVFNPLSNKWFLGPEFTVPRRWCVTGSADGALYMASGVGSQYHGDVARSVEQWDVGKKSEEWKWEKKTMLKDHRFSREAVDAVGYRGKLCMVNVKGNGPKEGAVFDVVNNQWGNMPEGMLAGWNGPAAAMEEETLYVVDEVKGALSRYDGKKDSWVKIYESLLLKGAQQIDADRGRVCVVCANGKRIAIVDVMVAQPRLWMIEPPQGNEAVAVHVLPRMTLHSQFV